MWNVEGERKKWEVERDQCQSREKKRIERANERNKS